MTIQEAKGYVGKEVAICWRDRKGNEQEESTLLYSVDFVPLYGPCLITDAGEIRLDRVVTCVVRQEKIA